MQSAYSNGTKTSSENVKMKKENRKQKEATNSESTRNS
jgi:hypothetical protein